MADKIVIMVFVLFILINATGCNKEIKNGNQYDFDQFTKMLAIETEKKLLNKESVYSHEPSLFLTENNIEMLSIGMAEHEIISILGDPVLKMSNQEEILFEILCYSSTIELNDYKKCVLDSIECVPENDLLPLIFNDKKLIGWGWLYLNDYITNNPNKWDKNWCISLNLYISLNSKLQ